MLYATVLHIDKNDPILMDALEIIKVIVLSSYNYKGFLNRKTRRITYTIIFNDKK
jgi:hypothetical protein